MKNSKILVIVLSILLIINIVIIAIFVKKLNITVNNNDKINKKISISPENNTEKFKYEYEKLNSTSTEDDENTYNTVKINTNVSIIYISLEELNELLNSNEAIIYVGSPTCPFCRTSIQPLLEVLDKIGIKTLYYYNNNSNINKSENYDEIMNELIEKDIVRVRDNGKTSFGMPLILKIKNSNVEKAIRGVTYEFNENQSEYDDITEEQQKIVYNRYYDNLK